MEILRRIGHEIGDEMDKLGKRLLLNDIAKDLGVTEGSVGKIGMKRFKKVCDDYFDELMNHPAKERLTIIEERLSRVPQKRREFAQAFINYGIDDYYKRKKESLKSKKD